VPKGVKNLLLDIGITRCIELGWWERHSLIGPSGKGIDIVFTPTKHWTSRTLFDKNTALWGSFAVIGASHRFFFSGDTAYCPVFKTIGEHYGPFDMSAISIGAYKPRYV
jgi:N-acyl-phosphatidylethanolamine-hydrolysing phospholipase D